MSSVKVFCLAFAALFVVWAVLVWAFGGEKYKKWYYQFQHADKYDTRKFKLVHVLFLFLAAVCFLLIGFWDPDYSHFVLLAFILLAILQYVLIYTVCKKKPESE